MIVKELSVPERIFILEAILERLLQAYPRKTAIQQDLAKVTAGFKGEKAVSYYLDFLPEKENFIFHSLRLPSGKHYFQIDYLILTTRYALILECKNFYGTLFFDDAFQQLIRTTNEKEEGFQDPISQAKWHQKQLVSWLFSHNISLPVEYFVVISNPSTILKTNPKNRQALNKVVHGHSLLDKIEELDGRYREEVLNAKELRKLSKLLLKSHTDETFDVLKKYGIDASDVLAGVRCPGCNQLRMIRQQRNWICPSCFMKDRSAHVAALRDYFYIMGPTITNKQFRDFVHLESEDTAQKLLRALNLHYSGEKKGRVYYKP